MKPLCLLTLLVTAAAAPGQPPPGGVTSPEVHPDRRVTFRVSAPKAAEVTLTADWLPPGATEKLTRDAGGVWSVTVGPLAPGIAIYNFTIDGVGVADPVNPRVKVRARTSASLVEVPGDGTELWEPGTGPHGRVELVYVRSEALAGQTREVRVYTPPGYGRDPDRKYPVLYLLHGSNDTAAGWTDVGRANFILDNLIARKKAVPMVIVMPWGHAAPFGAPAGDNARLFERFLLDDAMSAVERTYRTVAARDGRAIAGLSMGGGQAIQIGLGHLDLFSQVGAFSAAVPGDFATRFKPLLDDPNATNARLKLFFIACGRQDGLFRRSQQLDETLTARGIRHTFRPSEGLHNYAVWRLYLEEIAPQLFR